MSAAWPPRRGGAACEKPGAPPQWFACNGACTQGRACDCVADVEVEDIGVSAVTWRRVDLLIAVLFVAVVGFLAVLA